MKYLVTIAVASVLALMAGFIHAADTTEQQVEMYVSPVPSDLNLHHLETLPPPSGAARSEAKERKDGNGVGKEAESTNEAAALSGPAPALSYLQVSFVGSANVGGYEQIASSRYTTVYDHGGAWLTVVTEELGYGNAPVATINGSVLPASANFRTD